MILTIDAATTTGWAFGAPGSAVPMFGEHCMAERGIANAVAFDNFERWLTAKLTLLRPRYLYIEDIFPPRNRAVAQRLYGLRAITEMAAHRHDARLRSVTVHQVHRFFTGYGLQPKAEKKATTIRVCREYGWNVDTDNQADALSLWLYAEHQLAPSAASGRSRGTLFAAAR
jgi:Holliday junction resolvasome RuvABC endonuclease subunit